MTTIEYCGPWRELPDDQSKDGLQRQFDFEVTRQHPLWARGGGVIGKNHGTDDIIVRLSDGSLAIVHLTWSGRPGNERFPDTDFYLSDREVSEAIAFDAIGYD